MVKCGSFLQVVPVDIEPQEPVRCSNLLDLIFVSQFLSNLLHQLQVTVNITSNIMLLNIIINIVIINVMYLFKQLFLFKTLLCQVIPCMHMCISGCM